MIQSPFPPNITPFDVADVTVDVMFAILARVWGGTISRRAEIRSNIVSSGEVTTPRSEASEISESGGC